MLFSFLLFTSALAFPAFKHSSNPKTTGTWVGSSEPDDTAPTTVVVQKRSQVLDVQEIEESADKLDITKLKHPGNGLRLSEVSLFLMTSHRLCA
jgi:hypothetical protein